MMPAHARPPDCIRPQVNAALVTVAVAGGASRWLSAPEKRKPTRERERPRFGAPGQVGVNVCATRQWFCVNLPCVNCSAGKHSASAVGSI